MLERPDIDDFTTRVTQTTATGIMFENIEVDYKAYSKALDNYIDLLGDPQAAVGDINLHQVLEDGPYCVAIGTKNFYNYNTTASDGAAIGSHIEEDVGLRGLRGIVYNIGTIEKGETVLIDDKGKTIIDPIKKTLTSYKGYIIHMYDTTIGIIFRICIGKEQYTNTITFDQVKSIDKAYISFNYMQGESEFEVETNMFHMLKKAVEDYEEQNK